MQAKLAMIGGSGAYQLVQGQKGKILASRRVSTPFGEAAPLHFAELDNGQPYVFISRHGEDGYRVTAPFINYRANIWALKEVGVERIIAWSGPGAINANYKPGQYVIPDDLIDMTKNRPQTFFERRGLGFIRQFPVFCQETAQAMAEVLGETDTFFHQGGTYVCTEGPRLETPAEIRFFKTIGADMVGMTLVPEGFLARELEMCYAVISYITNYAEGVKPMDYQPGVLFEGTLKESDRHGVESAVTGLGRLVPQILNRLAAKERHCYCKEAMLRYKKRGDIGPDWHQWI